jgi:thiosulfate reductase cytochrome b subunit/mono/diheme cytochrome c family protein
MNRTIGGVSGLILALIIVLGATNPAAAAGSNPMHPSFHLLDAAGKMIMTGGKEPDQTKTCGQCHDTAFIAGHTIAAHQQKDVSCLTCHFECDRPIDCGKVTWTAEAFEPDGMIKRQWLRISKPAAANCGTCHGLATPPEGPVAIPRDYRTAAYPLGSEASGRYLLTRTEGSIFSAQDLSGSLLNLAGRGSLNYPWDVHARKMVYCTDCHYAPNDPQRFGPKSGAAALLRGEPRRETVSEYLKKPDHRLVSANCQTCHEPRQGHDFLPYRERHMQVVACESCHIPRQLGPAEQMVDATLLDEAGRPLVEYRGMAEEEGNLNTAYNRGFKPLLMQMRPGEKSGAGAQVRPVNLVSRWYWASGDSQEPISRETLEQALLVKGNYRPELVAALDQNHDGKLEPGELKLDSDAKKKAVERLLTAAGVKNPVIRADVKVHKITHGVSGAKQALSDCAACHGPDSRLKDHFLLASWAPGGILPPSGSDPAVFGTIARDAGGEVVWRAKSEMPPDLHVFGLTAKNWPDRLGLLMLIGVVLMVSGHGGYRWATRGRRPQHATSTRREYLFTAYERLWHWVMALSVVVLIITGLQIHFPGRINWLGAANAVSVHNFFGAALMINAFLALFYHLATAAIRQFLPPREGLVEAVQLQTKYYLKDIFKGLPAPFPRSTEHKLNALQQITYLLLLNFLFPFQMITGALIWLVGHYPAVAAKVGGLGVIAPLHNLGSWMFISFLAAHIYLATTGHTPLGHVRGMLDGYEEVEVAAGPQGERA